MKLFPVSKVDSTDENLSNPLSGKLRFLDLDLWQVVGYADNRMYRSLFRKLIMVAE